LHQYFGILKSRSSTDAKRAYLIARSKELYEFEFLETKAGVAGGKASGAKRNCGKDCHRSEDFAPATARATGKAERTVRLFKSAAVRRRRRHGRGPVASRTSHRSRHDRQRSVAVVGTSFGIAPSCSQAGQLTIRIRC
jgi:hypothetical protein